jgi:transmembrane sensor
MTLLKTDDYYQNLAKKMLTGKITPEEEKEFSEWYNQNQDLPLNIPPNIATSDQEMHDRILLKINAEIKSVPLQNTGWSPYRLIAACIVVFMVSFFIYFSLSKPEQEVALAENNILPGSNKATLTLSDGATVNLDDIKTGRVLEQEGIEIVKTADGLLTYTANPVKGKATQLKFNTISTPLGGQYKVILPDGTKVWLNAGSSLAYPTAFLGNERKVKLSGEGYFEVAKLKGMPFKVKTSTQEILVLGTHFNINAYANEPAVRTTLVEGSVEVRANGPDFIAHNATILKPGQQSVLSKSNQLTVKKVDVNAELAWKSGVFSFQNSDIQVVAREFSRWYNVEIGFEGEVPDVKLWGEMDRNVNATEALEILHYFKLKYKIVQQGKKKIIVISK